MPEIRLRTVAGVLRRPALWRTALVVAWRLAAPGWWRRWPPRPAPPAGYQKFRLQTFLGGTEPADLEPDDLVAYLRWCRGMARGR